MTGMRRIRKIIYLAVLLAVLVVPVSDVSAYTKCTKMTTCTTQTVSSDYIKKAKGEWYTYCPVGVTDNRKTTTFYCRNGAAGQVIDYIYSTSISVQGKKRTIVALKPSEDISRFDSVHVCDPTVISDSFEYQNKDYKYAMFYLGSQSLDNQCNRIGVALSNNINGRFIKPENNIVIDYTYDSNYPDVFQWGVGQPSAISLGNGKVLLFYTRVVYLAHENECDILYIDDEKYETMLDTIYSNLSESKYKNIIDGILGIYKMRFTKMQYMLEYQPMFVRVAHKYIYYVRS